MSRRGPHSSLECTLRASSLRFTGDLAVRAGKISYVGASYAGAATKEVDGNGKILAPGFIDIHTHFDPQVSAEREMRCILMI